MKHNATITEEDENGVVEKFSFDASDFRDGKHDGFRNAVEWVKETLEESVDGVSYTVIDRGSGGKTVKLSTGGLIYFNHNDGDVTVNLSMAGRDTANKVVSMFNTSGGSVSGDKSTYTDKAKGLVDGLKGGEYSPYGDGPATEPEDVQGFDNGPSEMEDGPDFYDPSESSQSARETKSSGKPFTKSEASYNEPGMGDEPMLDCSDCVHYNDGSCNVVSGEIDPDGYCDELYADFAIFGRADGNEARVNLTAWGDKWRSRLKEVHISSIVESVKSSVSGKLS